jgi:hypothetical protein
MINEKNEEIGLTKKLKTKNDPLPKQSMQNTMKCGIKALQTNDLT